MDNVQGVDEYAPFLASLLCFNRLHNLPLLALGIPTFCRIHD